MADHVYRGSQSLLDVQGEENTPATKDQELVATLSVESEQQEEQQEQKLAALLTVEETRQTDEEQQNLVALLDVQETRDENTQEQEIIALLDVLDEIPPIPVNPPQGLQAELSLLYLYNPDVTNSLIKELNLTIQEMNSAIEDVTQLTVDAMKIKPYSLLGEPIAQNTPCTFDGCVYIAITTITQKDPVFNPAQWAKVGTADYNKLYNKPNFITREDLSCTVPGLTYNSNTGVLSLTNGYVIPTSLKISQIDSGIATNAANLNAETQNRIQAINSANTRIDSLSADLTAEQTERIAADSSMANNITSINGRLVLHTSDYNNPHQVTKAQVGLGNVNNTADLDKPISTLTQQALDELSARIASTDADLINYRTSAAQDLIDSQIRVEISNVAQSVTVEEAARMSADAVLGGRITGIEEIIPSTASTDNLLADRAFVNSSINNMAAYYITASASGNAFGDHARLVSGPWYFQGQLRTPTMNDYALVVADETHDNKSARYLFDGVQWAFQYILNNTEFTQAQIDAINSTITKGKVDSYDAHIIDTNNPHEVTAEQVGLGNVNNTSDMNKPVSTLQQAALNLKQNIIADLETIRSGAALGTTAVQQADLAPYETISHAQATYQLKGDYVTTQTLNTALAGKQNVLTAGTGVTIENDVISVTQIQTIHWGDITGNLNDQLDLKNALNSKQDTISDLATIRSGASAGATAVQPSDLATVAITGSYNDLSNKPTIPAAQVNSDWNANSGVAQILNKPTIPTVNNPTITITQDGVTKGSFTLNQASSETIALDAGSGGGSGLNVGDIFYTMRNDNKLNGAVECNGAIYNTTDFTGAESIGNLLAAGKIDYISLTAYADAITQKGWCDKIGWNGTGNTQFRVPTLNAYIWQKLQMGVVGDGTPLGFNYNGNQAIINAHAENLGNNRGWVKARVNDSDTNVGDLAVSTDATQSGLLAGTSTDISQQRVMIQLAVATTDEALETCTGVLADVAALKYDYIVAEQLPTTANNYTWYRKYKSGWVEQGGTWTGSWTVGNGSQSTRNITLPVAMRDGEYHPLLNFFNMIWIFYGSQNLTTTGFSVIAGGYNNSRTITKFNWQVSGMSAN